MRTFESTVELAEQYDLVKVTPDAIIVTDPQVGSTLRSSFEVSRRSEVNIRELGGTGQSNYTGVAREDYNAELRGWWGLQMYERMRKSDGQIRATLRLAKTPVLAARWYVDTEGERKKDETIKNFIQKNLFHQMSTSFPQLLTEILTMLDFGYSAFEKVFIIKDGKVHWKKFAPRHQMDIREWKFDAHGGPRGFKIQDYNNLAEDIFIPIDKAAIFTYDKEGGDMTGVSVLRSAYKHWFYKENLYKIDAIQKERHGIGIPIIKLPPNFNNEDRNKADEIGRNLRTNEKAHIVLPPLWEIAMLKMEGQPVDALASAKHHDLMIARNILAQFINEEAVGVEQAQDMFLKSTRYVADIIRDVFNKYCIPQLVQYNWGEQDVYPELKARRLGDTLDWRTISFALRNFVGAKIIQPDDELEKWIRDEMDLPKWDPETSRVTETPQVPGAPGKPGKGDEDKGKPRQSPAGGMQQQAQGTGKSNVGEDMSGG